MVDFSQKIVIFRGVKSHAERFWGVHISETRKVLQMKLNTLANLAKVCFNTHLAALTVCDNHEQVRKNCFVRSHNVSQLVFCFRDHLRYFFSKSLKNLVCINRYGQKFGFVAENLQHNLDGMLKVLVDKTTTL